MNFLSFSYIDGQVVTIISGTLAATDGQDTASFSGTVVAASKTITGTLAATDPQDTFFATSSLVEDGVGWTISYRRRRRA